MEGGIVKGVIKDVRFRMMTRGHGCHSILNKVLCSNWGISLTRDSKLHLAVFDLYSPLALFVLPSGSVCTL